MKRSGPIKRKPKPKMDPALKALKDELTSAFVAGIRNQPCASCGLAAPAVTIRAHHVLRRQIIEAALKSRGASAEQILRAAWDPRNRLPVCDGDHQGHHSGMRRLALSLVLRLAPSSILFADELGLLHELERDYTTED